MSTLRNILRAALFAADGLRGRRAPKPRRADAQADRTRPLHRQDRRLQRLPYAPATRRRRQGPGEGLAHGRRARLARRLGHHVSAQSAPVMQTDDRRTNGSRPRRRRSCVRRCRGSLLHDMSESDLRAFYRFVRKLGPPAILRPPTCLRARRRKGPYVQFPAAPK